MSKFLAFSLPENAFSAYSRNQRFVVSRKECGNFHFLHFAVVRNPRFKGTKLRVCNLSACTKFRVSKFLAFWQSEYAILADSWTQGFKVPRKEWKFPSFIRSENVFLPSCEIHVSRVKSLKIRFLQICETNV